MAWALTTERACFKFESSERERYSTHVERRESARADVSDLVPVCFEGESFKAYREAERQRCHAEQAQLEDQQRALVLDDPDSSEEDKTLARKILGL